MYYSDIEKLTNSSKTKKEMADKSIVKYFARAIMAGIFLMLATILSYTIGAVLSSNYPEAAKISGAALFCFAIIAVVFFGGELFTGNNMVMFIGYLKKEVSLKDTMKIWIYSFIGNLIGIVIFAYMFAESGCNFESIKTYIEPIVYGKINLSVSQMIFRGILCNFSVCLAVYSGIRLKSETGKIILMFLCVFTFVLAGFEHSIANLAAFAIAFFSFGGLPMVPVLNNIFWVVIGNILGGGLILGGLLVISSIKDN
ncbi:MULTISPECIES: formate/nitrite transporter family protein [Clostridium]|uniref:formate/nitrite transporter family protein n=1 Tax=Clostridium TaxID=1485 RepID=UPI0002CBCC63|nr:MULTISPECIES: formate/nitrite transporter family protein [Clostridium]EMU52622.1 formate/nitrite transporter family protein [Clostridium butyricum DKU-01]KJZ84077.1 Formate efflux transporter (2.A.44 family) [Clostridium sp. IBUN125C]KJZ96086.1 Formate efflux transporter (2.A.44 family) [Clostridium sp. IBUN22A]KJZ96378.1 hypothetical protein ClosIBUN13A_CONTIG160g02439 [Clostridium sp. IBUN13A]MDU6040362.1 formate/nitrite transporter family protein [Clostridium butyricum]